MMKNLMSLILLSLLCLNLSAQTDTTKVKLNRKNVVTVIEVDDSTYVKIGNHKGVEVVTDQKGDTTQVRIGRRVFKVIDDSSGTHVQINRGEPEKKTTNRFNAHWAGIELGMNLFHQQDYSLYQSMDEIVPDEFMELRYGKSLSVNVNIFEWAFTNENKNFGVVTGLGFSFMDYTFNQPITIAKREGDGIIMPFDLESDGLKKSKLSISYITAPLMLEVKTPLRMGNSRLYLAGGVIGGVYLGSHTKYKYDNIKEKSRSNFNLNQFKYDLTGRIGFGDFTVFVNYGMTPLFNDNRGPELKPFTVGISLVNF